MYLYLLTKIKALVYIHVYTKKRYPVWRLKVYHKVQYYPVHRDCYNIYSPHTLGKFSSYFQFDFYSTEKFLKT